MIVPTLRDYIDPERLQQLQDMTFAVAQAPVRICAPDGAPLTQDSSAAADDGLAGPTDEVPVTVEGELIGKIRFSATSPKSGADGKIRQVCQWTAAVLVSQCQRGEEHASRVEELATLYRITAEFTGPRSLQGVLDLVARTVVEVLKAKACSIRLLNAERSELVIKAVANLSPQYLDKGPILLSDSKIDQEVISQLKTVYIADERSDPRVLYPAEARSEGIVSALCAPMVFKGRAEGVIRVYTAQPHQFDWFEISLLQAIAGQAAAAIVNARLHEEAVHTANIRRQLRLAAEVQRRMIPSRPPDLPGLEIGALYVPSFELGGDFYDFIQLPQDNWGISVCDVVGKGVRASLLMASIRASLRAHALNVYQMLEVLTKVNRDLCADTLLGDFATLFYGVLDSRARRLTYSNAGHVPPVLFRSGTCTLLGSTGTVLGIDSAGRWSYQVLPLQAGDVVLIYTDGLTEALNFNDEAFGMDRVQQAAMEAIGEGRSAQGILRHVLWTMRRFAGLQSRLDDLTLIAVKAL
jgi:sigma-B regulation protein RsbU (phosphoserine phosphatase)